MARLIAAIVRHGDYHQLSDTPSAHQPFPLNVEGEKQAQFAGKSILDGCKANRWQAEPIIDSSQMLRAWQTAEIIAETITANMFPSQMQVESFDALAERCVGSAANLTLDQIDRVLRDDPRFPAPPPGWKSDSHFRLPLQGAESLLDAGARVAEHLQWRMEALASIAAAGDRLKIFVGHGAAFRHAVCHLGVLDLSQMSRLSMHHGLPIYLEYLQRGEWRYIGGEWKIRT